ncbi:MAG: PTS sugar transporter subunit IIA [Deltaproteobacteria bacterium]|nr:PTS sugar transporter subunit IIA [Deltaproteobacteria bacterium]
MKVKDIVPESCVVIDDDISTKKELLKKIVEISEEHLSLDKINKSTVYTLLEKREQVGSTGFRGGIAIPHCRVNGLSRFFVGLVVVPHGIDFKSMDGENTSLFVFILAPEGQKMDHLKLLSGISRALMKKSNLDMLHSSKSSNELRKRFLEMLPDEIGEKPKEQSLVELVLERDEFFEDILENILGIATSPPLVIQGKSALEYLHKVPLFADLWNMKQESYCTIIRFIVDKRLTNEAVRRIEGITGPLSEGDGVLVFTTEIQYLGGKLRD